MKKVLQREVTKYQNRYSGEELLLIKGGVKYFTIEYAGVTLVLDDTDLYDLLEMLKEVYKDIK